jgi:tight adherence protein B
VVPVLLSIAFGAAVFLVYEALTKPPPAAPEAAGGDGPRRARDFLARAGLHDVPPRDFVVFALGSGLASGLVAQLLLGWGLVSLLAAGLGLAAPVAYFVRRHDRRRAAVQAALGEAIAQLRDGIRTGLSVQEAQVALARSGPEALRPDFARLVRETRLVGPDRALAAMQERLADPVFDVVAATLLLNDRVGGSRLSEVLDRLAQATRAELRLQEELRAYQARHVLSARIVAAVPLVVLVAIRQLNPSYLAVFDDWPGQLRLAGCAASVALGYAAMLWVARLPGEERVLRP